MERFRGVSAIETNQNMLLLIGKYPFLTFIASEEFGAPVRLAPVLDVRHLGRVAGDGGGGRGGRPHEVRGGPREGGGRRQGVKGAGEGGGGRG